MRVYACRAHVHAAQCYQFASLALIAASRMYRNSNMNSTCTLLVTVLCSAGVMIRCRTWPLLSEVQPEPDALANLACTGPPLATATPGYVFVPTGSIPADKNA